MEHVGERRTRVRNRISTREYSQYRFAVRDPPENEEDFEMELDRNEVVHFDAPYNRRRLFQQYAIDMQVRIKTQKLQFIRNNQQSLRVETYGGLQDLVQNANLPPDGEGEEKDENASIENNETQTMGRRVILPTSYINSPRYMSNLYQNAMAIVRVLGRPDLFVTFTCNTERPEIRESMPEHQKVPLRNDFINRVFCDQVNNGVTLIPHTPLRVDQFILRYRKVNSSCYRSAAEAVDLDRYSEK